MTQTKAELLQTRHQGDIRLGDADSTNYVGFKAPATVGSNLVWTLPATDGSANQFLQTNASGVLGWGTADVSSAMPLSGGTHTGNVTYNDNVKARFGTGLDLQIYHDNGNSYIKHAGVGNLRIETAGGTDEDIYLKAKDAIFLQPADGEDGITIAANGAVQLFYNDAKKFETTSGGVAITGAATISTNLTVTGDLTVSGTTTTIDTTTLLVEDKNIEIGKVSSPSDTTADGGGWTLKGASDKTFNWVNATDAWTSSEHIHILDTKKLILGGASGTTDGLEIYHSSAHSFITNSGTGNLYIKDAGFIRMQTDNFVLQSGDANYTLLSAINGGACELYHNNSKKLETTTGGINVTGAINVNGSALSTSPSVTAVADGALAAGDPVYMKTDGKVKKVHTSSVAASVPSEQIARTNVTGHSNLAGYPGGACSPEGISVFYFRDHSNTNYRGRFSTAKINSAGTGWDLNGPYDLAGNTPSHNGVAEYVCTNNGNPVFIMTYSDLSNQRTKAKAIMVNASTLAATQSSETNLCTSSSDTGVYKYGDSDDYTVLFPNNVHNSSIETYILEYDNSSSSVGNLTITTAGLTQPGNSTKGSDTVYVYDPDEQEVVMHFRHNGTNGAYEGGKGNTNWLNIYGKTSMSSSDWGTRKPWNTTASNASGSLKPNNLTACYDESTNRHVIVFNDSDDSDKLKIMIGTNNGFSASTMTWGTPVVVDKAGDSGEPSGPCVAYHEALEKVILSFTRTSDNVHKYAILAIDPSDNSVTVGTNFVSNDDDGRGFNQNMAYDHATGHMHSYLQDNNDNSIGKISAIKVATASSTSTQFIGFNQGAVSSGGNATIDIVSSTNSHQSGLTVGSRYYVGTAGTLSTTADNPSVEAGTAIAADKIIVKG